MTAAKLLPLPESHGLSEARCAEIYDVLVSGKPLTPIVAVVVLQPAGYGERRDSKSNVRKRHVEVRPLLLEILEDTRASQARLWLAEAIEARTGARSLPLDFGDRDQLERAEFLKNLIREHADEKGITAEQLADDWRSYFGGPEYDGYVEFESCNGPTKLLEFATARGALPDDASSSSTSDEGAEQELDDESGDEPEPVQRQVRGRARAVKDVPLPEPAGAS